MIMRKRFFSSIRDSKQTRNFGNDEERIGDSLSILDDVSLSGISTNFTNLSLTETNQDMRKSSSRGLDKTLACKEEIIERIAKIWSNVMQMD